MNWGWWSFRLWWNCGQISPNIDIALNCRHCLHLHYISHVIRCKGSGPSWNVWIGIPWPFDKLVFFWAALCMHSVMCRFLWRGGVWVGYAQECTRFSRKRTRRWRPCQNVRLRLESAKTLSLEAIRVVGVGIWPVPFSAPLLSVPRAPGWWLETSSCHLFVGHFSSLCRL